MAQRPADLANRERAREMPIYKRYFDLIAAGKKTIEVRVAYPSNKRLVAGQLLKFTCRGEECLTRIKRIASHLSFDEMFDHENVSTVNPTATRAEQLGPDLTGVLAPFPIATSVVAAFALGQSGPPAAVRVLHGVPRGLLGFSVFCFLMAVLVVPLGTGAAFLIAIAATLVVQMTWRAVTMRPSAAVVAAE